MRAYWNACLITLRDAVSRDSADAVCRIDTEVREPGIVTVMPLVHASRSAGIDVVTPAEPV